MATKQSGSIFSQIDWGNVQDDPFAVPDNTYIGFLTEAKFSESQRTGDVGLNLTYRISEGEHEGKTVREWKRVPSPADPKSLTPEEAKALSFVKQRLLDLGVPHERLSTALPEDLVGTRVVFSTQKNGDYTNIRSVKAVSESYEIGD